MQEIKTGFVVWRADVGVPVVFFVVEISLGVGAVIDLDQTTPSEIEANKRNLLRQGYTVIETENDGTSVMTMLPPHWDREATMIACDQFADMWIAETEKNIRGGGNVN